MNNNNNEWWVHLIVMQEPRWIVHPVNFNTVWTKIWRSQHRILTWIRNCNILCVHYYVTGQLLHAHGSCIALRLCSWNNSYLFAMLWSNTAELNISYYAQTVLHKLTLAMFPRNNSTLVINEFSTWVNLSWVSHLFKSITRFYYTIKTLIKGA